MDDMYLYVKTTLCTYRVFTSNLYYIRRYVLLADKLLSYPRVGYRTYFEVGLGSLSKSCPTMVGAIRSKIPSFNKILDRRKLT